MAQFNQLTSLSFKGLNKNGEKYCSDRKDVESLNADCDWKRAVSCRMSMV